MSHRNFGVIAQWQVKLHLALSRTINSKHSHASFEKVFAIHMKLFFHRVETRQQNNDWRFGRMPGFSENTIHSSSLYIRNSYSLAWKVEIRESFLVRVHNMFVCYTQFFWMLHKDKFTKVVSHSSMQIMVCSRCIILISLSPLPHLFMHRCTCRPFSTPISPTLNLLC